MNSKPLIIVGTGRSGTSLTAAICDYLGVYMGEVIEADAANPTGYWEESFFTDRNQVLMQGKISEEDFFNAIRPVADKRAAEYKHWGIKHPMIAHIIPAYKKFFNNPKFIWCQRDREGVIGSLKEKYEYQEEDPEQVYDTRWEQLVEGLGDYENCLEIDFERLTEDTRNVVDEIVEFEGLTVSEERKEKAAGFAVDQNRDISALYICPPEGNFTEKKVNEIAWTLADDRFDVDKVPEAERPLFGELNRAVSEDFDHDYLIIGSRDAKLTVGEGVRRRRITDLLKLDRDVLLCPVDHRGKFGCCDRIRGQWQEVVPARRRGLREVDGGLAEMMVVSRRVLEDIEDPFLPEFEDGVPSDPGLAFCQRAKEAGFEVWAHWDYTAEK